MYILLWTIAERFGFELDLRYDDVAQQWNISLCYPEYRLKQEFYIYDEAKSLDLNLVVHQVLDMMKDMIEAPHKRKIEELNNEIACLREPTVLKGE
jgi:hypothetical protein